MMMVALCKTAACGPPLLAAESPAIWLLLLVHTGAAVVDQAGRNLGIQVFSG